MKKQFLILACSLVSLSAFSQNAYLDFDGVNDHVNIGTQLGNQGIRTIELWFRPSANIDHSLADYQSLLIRNSDDVQNGSAACEYGLAFLPASSAGKLGFTNNLSNGTVQWIFSNTSSWAAGVWHHVAVVISSSGPKMYIDGNLEASTDNGGNSATYASSPCTTSDTTVLGRWGNYNGRYFHGSMDEVRIWNVERTQQEIQASLSSELSGNETGLAAYYTFDEGTCAGNNSMVTTLNNSAKPVAGTDFSGKLVGFALQGPASNWLCSNSAFNITDVREAGSQADDEFSLYPNPAADNVYFSGIRHGKMRIQVTNMLGSVIYSKVLDTGAATEQINVSGMAAGIYAVSLLREDGRVVKSGRFIRQ